MIDKEIPSGGAGSVQTRAQAVPRESEELYRKLVESSNDVIFITERDGTFRYINQIGAKMLGIPAEDVIGKNVADVFPPAIASRQHQLGTEAYATAQVVSSEMEIAIFGERRYFDIQLVPLVGKTGGVTAVMGSVRDITQRRQTEEALRESEERLRDITLSMADWVWEIDTHYVYTYSSTKGCGLLGQSPENVIGKTPFDFMRPDEAARVSSLFERVVAERAPIRDLENWCIGKDGTQICLLTNAVPILNEDGVLLGYRGVDRDITDRKRAEEALKEREEYARTLLESIDTGIAMIDAESHVIVDANPAFIAMLHSTKESILGGVCHTFICPAEQGNCPVSDLGQSVDRSERVVLSARGDKIPVIKSVSPITLHGHSYLLETFVDISDRVRVEAEKDLMQAQLQQSQKMETIGQLAGGVAHDFNNLLTGILGNIALVHSSLSPTDPLLENLDAAETAAHQAANLTKGLLTFSRSAVVLPVSMKITTALDVSLMLVRQSLPATIRLIRDDEQPAWNVLLDQTQMTQILLNLVVNACDAMQANGTLTMCTQNVTVDAAYVRDRPYACTGEFVRLSIADTGSGMSPDAMKHLFEPFYTTKPVGSGTGLGLSIVYGAVKQAGGWIETTSAEDAGMTFYIYLPRSLEESGPQFVPASILLDVGSGTILVVEDEPIVSTVAQALLSKSGYAVMTAPDGASALNALREDPTNIDLILLDMTMPGMTTDEILPAIRTLSSTVRILLTSGYTSNSTINRMLEEGVVQGFLGKPYTRGELVEKVQELLRRS